MIGATKLEKANRRRNNCQQNKGTFWGNQESEKS
jgi:hypothetical protein